MPDSTTDFLKGTLDLMVLKTLSWAPAHGYGIARWIEQCTDDVLSVEEGSLYPALYKLEEAGLVASDCGGQETPAHFAGLLDPVRQGRDAGARGPPRVTEPRWRRYLRFFGPRGV